MSRRAFEIAFLATPRAKVQMVWTRFYVEAMGDDSANHARAMELARERYPQAVCVGIKEVSA